MDRDTDHPSEDDGASDGEHRGEAAGGEAHGGTLSAEKGPPGQAAPSEADH